MKKTLIAIALIIAICSTLVFSACDIIEINEERDYAQAVVTITFGDLTDTVTKAELMEAFNSTGYYYVYYYSMSVTDVMDIMLKSLVQSKLTTMNARIYYATAAGKDINTPVVELLRNNELNYAIEQANENFQSMLDEYITEIEEEKALANATEEEDDEEEDEEETSDFVEETLAARATKTSTEDEDEVPEFTADNDIDASAISGKFFDLLDAELAANKDDTKSEAERRLKKALEENYRDYDYYLMKQAENVLTARYRREQIEGTITVTDEQITARYNEYITSNKLAYDANSRTDFETAIATNMEQVVYQPFTDYGYVNHVLIKFSDAQTALITNYDYADDETQALFAYDQIQNMTVNISNPDYDSAGECADAEYDLEGDENITADPTKLAEGESYTRLQIINQHACSVDNCPLKAYVALDVDIETVLTDLYDDITAQDGISTKLQAFDNWIYTVNDDTGIQNKGNYGYLITPESETSTYEVAFAALSRALVLKGAGAWSLTDEEITALQARGVEGAESIFNYPLADGKVMTLCITSYGIHIIICTSRGISSAEVTAGTYTDTVPLEFALDNYDGETLKQVISEVLLEEMKSDEYTHYASRLYIDNEGNTTTNDKLYNKIVDEYKELFGETDEE